MKPTKTGKERIIPLDDGTLAELRTFRSAQAQERMRFGPAWRGAPSALDDYVCAGPNGAVMNPDRLEYRFGRFTRQHGYAGLTLHQLRHAWVSQQIALGFDAVTIASMSGHSTDVLLKTYAHAFDKRKREAMEALASARNSARSG